MRIHKILTSSINFRISLVVILLIGIAVPSHLPLSAQSVPDFLMSVKREPQGFVILPYSDLPNAHYFSPAQSDSLYYPVDRDSIEVWPYNDGIYYHPTYLCHRAEGFIGAYHDTNRKEYLDRAERYAQKAMAQCVEDSGAIYTAFHFPFAVHGDSSILLDTPWVSGMSQGELLMVTVRLYEFAGKKEYLDFAQKLFIPFLFLKESHNRWFARIDSAGYYWAEEYPHNQKPGLTLNGFIYAVYGLYDYYRLTGDSRAKAVYDMSLTTLKQYLPLYRREGEASYYCLGHKHITDEGYHFLHVQQLQELCKMTGDSFFREWADRFESDGIEAFRTNFLVRAYGKFKRFLQRTF